jgi:hypothetical protein
MPTLTLLLAVLLSIPSLGLAQIEPDWHELNPTATERVAVDLNSFRQAGSVRRASLRWHILGTAGRLASYTLEDTEIDCARWQGRVHARRRVVVTPDRGRTEIMEEPSTAQAKWHSYSPGSLGHAVWIRMCEVPIPGA